MLVFQQKQVEAMRRLSICVIAVLAGAASVSMVLAQDAEGATVDRYESYLAENAKREGVTTTLSGLQYAVLKSGDGPQPGPNTPCAVHYTGKLIDGTKFGVWSHVFSADSVRCHSASRILA